MFVAYRNRNGIVEPAGTAFLVGFGEADPATPFIPYFVTAKHVIAGIKENSADHKVLLRVNERGGSARLTESDLDKWRFHPHDQSVDVAVLPVALGPKADMTGLLVERAVTDEAIEAHQIGAGDQVFLTGLFVDHMGSERMLPIVRSGTIALMPEEKIATPEYGPIDAYLIECRSIGGLSGSPVFWYPGVRQTPSGWIATRDFWWLGLIHGHFDDVPDNDSPSDAAFSGERLNKGIAIVIPAPKVLEVLDQKRLRDAREKQIAENSNSSA